MMSGSVYRAISKAAARGLRSPGVLNKITTPLQHPNSLGTTKQTSNLLTDYQDWAHKNSIFGRWDGTAENVPELGRALIEKLPKNFEVLTDPRKLLTTKLMSPHYYAEKFFGVSHNPVRESTDCLNIFVKGSDDLDAWWKVSTGRDRWGLGGFVPDKRGSTAKKVVDVLEQEVDGVPVHSWYKKSCAVRKGITNVAALYAKEPDVNKAVGYFRAWQALEASKIRFDSKWKPLHEELAKRLCKESPECRIAFAVEGHPEWAWLEPMLNAKEKKLAGTVRGYFQRTRKELDALGIPVLPAEQGYIPHLASELPGVREKFFAGGKRDLMKKSLDFSHRNPGSVMWFPSLNEIMEYYTKAATKKIAFQPFVKKWADFRNQLPKQGRRGELLSKWWDDWYTSNYERIATDFETKLGRIGNAWVRLEYIRLIGGSLSVGLKHWFKMFGSAIVHGYGPTTQAFYPTTKAGFDLARKAFGKVKPLGVEAEIASHYIRSRIALRAIFETPGIKRSSMILERLAGQPTMAVEAFDRGVNLFATMYAGSKSGVSYEKIHKGILDYIMKVNFVGGFDQFTWMKTPFRRAIFMFQMTPAKLAQFRFKLIEDALKGKKDVFGRNTGAMIIRALCMYGVAEAWARQHDMSLMDHILHLPFTKHTPSGETTVFQSPVFGLVFDRIQEHGFSSRGFAMALRDHFEWMGTGSKIAMIHSGDYPYKYKTEEGLSQNWRLMLGLPSLKAKERQEKFYRRKKLRRDIRRIKKYKKRGTFFPEKVDKALLDLIRD